MTEQDTINDLIDDLENAHDEIKAKIRPKISKKKQKVAQEDEQPEAEQEPDEQPDLETKRKELLKLAEDGNIDKSVSYIKKASHKAIDKLYTEYERKRMQKANEFLTDLLISKFSSTLGGLDAIDDPEVLSDELRKDELLKRDVYSLVETISPYLPFPGILSGGVTTAKHIYDHKTKPMDIETVE